MSVLVVLLIICAVILSIGGVVVGVVLFRRKKKRNTSSSLQHEAYEQMQVKLPKRREARYSPGEVVVRNLQDPSLVFRFGGEVGVLEGADSIGAQIVIESVYTDEKYVGDMW